MASCPAGPKFLPFRSCSCHVGAQGVLCVAWRTSDPKPRFSALVADDYESKAVISDKKNRQNGTRPVSVFCRW